MQLDELEKKFDTTNFSLDIENIVLQHGLSYLDALMFYLEDRTIEPEVLASLVRRSPILKSKLEAECIQSNLVQGKSAKLPFID
jgi:hypothetical protein